VLGRVPTKDPKFKPTSEEMGKFQKAMDDPKFRDMFRDYLEEINDPENLKRREQELLDMEKQGMAPEGRQLMKPSAKFAVSLDLTEGKGKVVINMCSGKPCKDVVLDKGKDSSGTAGVTCHIPYILGHLRTAEHPDTGDLCQVFDIAFSENTMKSAKGEKHFREVVIKTAIEAVEKMLKEGKIKDLNAYKEMPALGEAAVLSVNVDSVENPSLPTFAPKHKVLPNPAGVKCPEHYVRMEASKGVRTVVVCIILTDTDLGDDYADVDIMVDYEVQKVFVAYKQQYRLDLRLAFPFEKEYQVKWKKRKQQLKISLTVLPDFNGRDQKIPYRKTKTDKTKADTEKLTFGAKGKKKSPYSQVKISLPARKAFPCNSEVKGNVLVIQIDVPAVVSSSIDTSITSDKRLRISFFTSTIGGQRILHSSNVELPFDIETSSRSIKVSKSNLLISYQRMVKTDINE